MEEAVIVEAVRTSAGRGKASGALAGVHPVDLLAGTLRALVDRAGIDPGLVDDVLVGCVQQVGEQSGNIARNASLAAGFPEMVPAATVNRQCGSSQQAATFAAQAIMSGSQDIVIAAGVESMSAIPLGTARPATQSARSAIRYPAGLVHQGVSAELMADKWKLSRGRRSAPTRSPPASPTWTGRSHRKTHRRSPTAPQPSSSPAPARRVSSGCGPAHGSMPFRSPETIRC